MTSTCIFVDENQKKSLFFGYIKKKYDICEKNNSIHQ